MENSLKIPNETPKSDSHASSGLKVTEKAVAGKIAAHIGTGKNAKDPFIWMTITWSFVIATSLCLLLFIRSFFVVAKDEVLLDSLVQIWTVFVPIITLALGYAFGKGE